MKTHADFAVVGFLTTLLLCSAAMAPSALGQTSPTFYSVTDLRALGMTYVGDINNQGQVVGGNGHALLYSGGTMTDLGTLGGDWSIAEAINDGGQVVGASYYSPGYPHNHAFLYSGGTMIDLGAFSGGDDNSWAYGINNSGQIVGVSSWTYGDTAFLYSGGSMMDLWPLTYGCYGVGINNSGQTVINVTAPYFDACYLYGGGTNVNTGGVLTGIGAIGDYRNGTDGAALNDNGQVVGTSSGHAFLCSGGVTSDLGPGAAYDINNNSQVVGISNGHGFLYTAGTMTDISLTPDLAVTRLEWDATTGGLKFSYAVSMVSSPTSSAWHPIAINDHGQILCDNGTLLTPITPPKTSAKLFWADSVGTKISDTPIFVQTIPAGFTGDSGPIPVPVSSLQNRPPNATQLLLVLDPDNQLPEINKANNVATLNYVCFGPVITVQPLNQTNIVGASVTFSVGAASAEPLRYQWRYQGASLQNDGRISGANAALLTIANIQTNDIGDYDVIVSNDCGTTNSLSASLTITAKPVITDQPHGQTNAVWSAATFVVGVVGSPPLTYRWRHEGANLFNGGNVSGADSSALHLANLQTNDAGTYDVIVTNDYGSVTSVAATLTVTSVPPAIVQPPQPQFYVTGSNAYFTNIFSGTEPLSYQWRKDGMNLTDDARITGASGTVITHAATHTSVLTIAHLQPDDIGDYSVVITNVAGSVTSTVAGFFPIITSGPAIYTNITVTTGGGFFTNISSFSGDLVAGSSVTLVEGDSVAIAYGFLASMPMTLTWRQATNVFTDIFIHSYDIAPLGVVGSANVITNVQPQHAGLYEIVVTNNYGAITSAVATVIVKTKPHITLQPLNQKAAQGGTNVFQVVFNGTEPLSLQWRKDGTNLMDSARISGATATLSAMANSHTNWLIMENLQTNDAGNYSVVITNNYGSITSVLASLTVGVAPVVTNQPASQTNVVGASVVFRAGAGGTEPFSYQWRQNGTNLLNGGRISGATSSALAVANIQLTDAGGYDVVVTNDYGYTNSSIATLGVQADNGGDGGGGTNGGSNLSGGLLLWLPFDGNAQDVSGNGRDGVVQGAVLTTNRFGKADSAYAFDGSSAITVANLDPDGYTNGFSFGAWIEPNGFGGAMGWTYDAGWGATFVAAGGSPIQFRVGTGDPSTDHSVSAIVPLQSWSHVLIAHSPTNDSLYVNGQLMGQWPSHLMAGNASAFTVGTSYAGNFNGAIDDVVVYGRELSSDEVAALYYRVSPGGSDANFPLIISQPVSLTVTNGGSGSFRVRVLGTLPFSYQWRRDGTNLVDGGNVSGAGTNQLMLANVQAADAAGYDVIITNNYGSVTSLVATLTVQTNNLSAGLLVWFPFDGNAVDASGNGRDGVVQGAVLTTNRFGDTDSAYVFNGANYIQVNNLDPDDYTNGLSFGAWLRPDANGGALGWTYDGGWGATFIADVTSAIYFRVGTGDPATDHTISTNIPLGEWSHVFLTHSPTTDSLYLNGQLVGQWPSLAMQGNVSTLLIGSTYAGNFVGAIDEVAVYGRALMASEVAALFSGAQVISGPPPQLMNPTASGGGFSFNLVATPGTQFTILVSTNLTDWAAVRTVTIPPEGSTNILEGVTPGARQKFYRAMQQ